MCQNTNEYVIDDDSMDDLICSICGRSDKPEDFRHCEDCGNDVCESCYIDEDLLCEICLQEVVIEQAKS
jgi:hypothetical protein